MNDLPQLVLRRLGELGDERGPLSFRQAAHRSHGMVSYELLRKIARGQHSGRISDTVAYGLSTALDIPVADVYAAAKVPRPQSSWLWPSRFNRLTLTERHVVESVASAILEAREQGFRDSSHHHDPKGDTTMTFSRGMSWS